MPQPVKYILLWVLFSCFAIASCKKDKSTPAITPGKTTDTSTYSITCWNKVAGQITNFLASERMLKERWDFGDGDTLLLDDNTTLKGPLNHIYKAPGVYTVTLVIDDDIANKVTQLDTIAPNYWFYYNGLPITGDTLFFRFHAFLPPTGVSYSWTFGDGATSPDSTPYHVFNSAGNYVVKLTINGNPGDPDIYQVITIKQDPLYTHLMTNTRLWHGDQYKYYFYTPSDTTHTILPDNSFALIYVDKLTVQYYGSNFVYDPSQSYGDVITFSYSPGSSSEPASTISYNHVTDTMSMHLYGLAQDGPGHPPYMLEYLWRTP